MSPGADPDAIHLSDEYVYPQLESTAVYPYDKHKKSEKQVADARATASCLKYFNSMIAVSVMILAMFAFGNAAIESDEDGTFISFYIMLFCFFLLMFEWRESFDVDRTQEEQEAMDRELEAGIIRDNDPQMWKRYPLKTKFRHGFGFMFDSNLRVFFMFFVALECFALGKVGMIGGILFAVGALVNAFIRCTRPKLYTHLGEPRIRLPAPIQNAINQPGESTQQIYQNEPRPLAGLRPNAYDTGQNTRQTSYSPSQVGSPMGDRPLYSDKQSDIRTN